MIIDDCIFIQRDASTEFILSVAERAQDMLIGKKHV